MQGAFPAVLPWGCQNNYSEAVETVGQGTGCCQRVPGVHTGHVFLGSLSERHCMDNICIGMVSHLNGGEKAADYYSYFLVTGLTPASLSRLEQLSNLTFLLAPATFLLALCTLTLT